MLAGTLEIQMLANIARFADDMHKATDIASGAMKKIESAAASAKAALESLGIGVGLSVMFKDAVAAASLFEQASNRLNAVIKATGDTSGFTRDQLDKMADALSKSTTFDQTSIIAAQGNLLKFGRVHGETFERALKLSADYAAFTGGTMVEATQRIGKALADPIGGVTMLGRELGKLSTEQKESIANFVSQGDLASAQAVIFKKLESSIGGTAGAMNSGLFGATSAVTKAWDEFLISLGKSGPVQIIATNSLSLLAEGINHVTENLLKQNRALANNPLYNGGRLQPLPQITGDPLKSLQGSGLTIKDVQNLPTGLRPSLVPADQNATTVGQYSAMSRGAAAGAAEDAKAYAEAQKALMKELRPLADELSDAYAKADIKQKEAAQEMLANFFGISKKEMEELNGLADELGKASVDAEQRQLSAAAEMRFSFQEEENKRLGVLNEDEKRDALVDLIKSLRSQNEIEEQDWVQKQQLVQERFIEDYDNRKYWEDLKYQLYVNHEAALGNMMAKAQKQRFEFAKMTAVQQTEFVIGQLIEMTSAAAQHNRAMFEINKVAAIANAVMKGAESVLNSFAWGTEWGGPVAGAAMAAIAAAATAVNIAAIANTQYGGGITSSSAPSIAGSTQAPPSASPAPANAGSGQTTIIHVNGETFGRKQLLALIAQINETTKDGGRIVVD